MDALLEVSFDGFRFENGSGTRCKPRNPQDSIRNSFVSLPRPEHENPPSGDSPACSDDFAVLKYINDMLMEEDLEGRSCVSQDSLALQAAERSFYEVLHDQSSLSGQNSNDQSEDLTRNLSTTTGSSSHRPASDFTGSPENTDSESALFGESQRRYRPRDDDDTLESGRTKKQPAIWFDTDLPEKFEDLLLICTGHDQEASNPSHHNRSGRAKGSSNRSRTRNPEPVDIRSLLMQCAQAVASFDHRTATEKLKEIRSHSARNGNGTQRLAFHFAEGLQARIAGTQSPPVFYPLPCDRTSMVDILNAYKVFVQACPVNKMSYYVANKAIFDLASKASRLHIIDFGILYGFQWPCLIQALSNRPGGPPLLRITGIELPQPGFRPSERVEETGGRLKRFCDRFNVPFEYNFIAKKWETISLEELEIHPEETTVVNCLYRLRYTPDETVSMNPPRDMVLKLFRDINPNLFVFAEVNGMYNSPFFVTRFREALFHFSSLFDMFEATTRAEDEHRTLLEKELFVRDAVNVIASEGVERVDRPETYKQWQVRTTRAGFRPIKLNKEITKEAKEMVRKGYHRDFVIDDDSHWLFQGWKGRVLYALSCWKPAEK
ncbi:PREDICTED: scarecrow-like protein 30 [Tarenaya hassleriana]|uniref:scarecrow-like protein 30 n=1 Tax=Tarenaya hassleriana TaxID=28532 RepID=UPI00053C95B1|nr:PREDICTED: scarecrow-like protein 30 [Tarenaya hassleriana]